MQTAPPPDITVLLREWTGDDSSALERLIPVVHAELRPIAGKNLRRRSAGDTLAPTALVNEACLRLCRLTRSVGRTGHTAFAGHRSSLPCQGPDGVIEPISPSGSARKQKKQAVTTDSNASSGTTLINGLTKSTSDFLVLLPLPQQHQPNSSPQGPARLDPTKDGSAACHPHCRLRRK